MALSLTRCDLGAVLDALGTVSESAIAAGAFARQGAAALRGLVASDLVTLSSCDLATGHRSVAPDSAGAFTRQESDAFDRHFHRHPLVRAHGRNPCAVTRRISDLVPAAEFRRTALYNDYYRRIGIEHAMAVPIHVRGDELVGFVLNRSGRDFSERDAACAEAMRPHLAHLYRLGREIAAAHAPWGVPGEPGAALTEREREVMDWVRIGKTDRDIGHILGISYRTVHKHLQRIYDKLGVETRTAASFAAAARRSAA